MHRPNQAAFQAVAHGTFQVGMTAISGGKFWSGFAAGALSSIASSAWGGGSDSQWQGLGGKLADNGAGIIAFGTVAGGAGAALTGGNFWQGAVTGLVVSGLNHFAHQIQEKQTLDAFAKEKFGADYKSKYGVKSLKWGSQMKKGEVAGYKYNAKEQLIYGKDGAVGGITTPDGRIYISDTFGSYSNTSFLEGTIGHELVHSYQHMKFGSSYNSSYSEFSAYQYSIDFSIKNNFDSSMTQQYKSYQSSYTKGPKSYNYQNIPGF